LRPDPVEIVLEALELASSEAEAPEDAGLEKDERLLDAEKLLAEASFETLKSAVHRMSNGWKPEDLASKLLDVANVFRDDYGNLARAKDFVRLALSVAQQVKAEIDRQPLLAEVELQAGHCLREEREFQEARRAFARAALYARAAGDDPSLTERVRRAQDLLREEGSRPLLGGTPEQGERPAPTAPTQPGPAEQQRVLEQVNQLLLRGDYDAARHEFGRVVGQELANEYLARAAKMASVLVTFQIYRENRQPADAVEVAELDLWEGQILTYLRPQVAERLLLSALQAFQSASKDFDAAVSCLCLVILYLRQDRPSDAAKHLESLTQLSRLEGVPEEAGLALREFCGSAAEGRLDLAGAQAIRRKILPSASFPALPLEDV
jgi:hypothetical protein